MKLTATILIACLLTACGSGCEEWPMVPEKETHVRQGSAD